MNMLKFITKLRLPHTLPLRQYKSLSFFGGGHTDHQPIDRERINLRDQKSGYYLNPNETARRTMRIISQFDKINDPQNMTLNSQWHQLGLNQLDTVQLLIGIQQQFRIQFPDDISEKFKDINDVVEYIARSFYSE